MNHFEKHFMLNFALVLFYGVHSKITILIDMFNKEISRHLAMLFT